MYPKPVGPLSHARKILIGLIESRRLRGTLHSWGITNLGSISSIYKTALGQTAPTYWIIFCLREHIAPELWYYEETEALPKPLPFKALYPSIGGGSLIRKILESETAAIGDIKELIEKRELAQFCTKFDLDYQELWGCCNKRKKADGRYGYHRRPSYRVIKTLRDAIHPARWYVFHDEL
jgi:hypothetical protein